MAKLKVTLASKARDYTFTGRDGQDVAMVEYQVAVTDDTGAQTLAKLSRSAKKPAPEVGDEISGTISQSEKYGIEIKEDRQGGGGRGGWQRDPLEQAAIMRQSSLERATEIAITMAQLVMQTEEDKKAAFDLAKSYFTPSKIMRLADVFYLYADGKMAAATSQAPAAPAQTESAASVPAYQSKQAVEQAFPGATEEQDDPDTNPQKHTHDVNPDELPL